MKSPITRAIFWASKKNHELMSKVDNIIQLWKYKMVPTTLYQSYVLVLTMSVFLDEQSQWFMIKLIQHKWWLQWRGVDMVKSDILKNIVRNKICWLKSWNKIMRIFAQNEYFIQTWRVQLKLNLKFTCIINKYYFQNLCRLNHIIRK